MNDILVWRLTTYSAIAVPCLVLAWAWVRWCRSARGTFSPRRRQVTFVSIVTLTTSAIALLLFPEALEFFAGKPLEPWNDVYIYTIRLGFFGGLAGTLLAMFAMRSVLWPLITAGGLLIGSWFLAAQSV
jgi:hypothetical protein